MKQNNQTSIWNNFESFSEGLIIVFLLLWCNVKSPNFPKCLKIFLMLSVCWCDSVGHALGGGVSEVIWGDSGPKSFVQEVYA